MDNRRIAEFFEQMADIMDILGENAFRIRSYRNIARTIADLPESMEGMIAAGVDIEALPGIGKGSAAKIHEIIETGKLRALDELRAKIPAGLPDLLRLQGLGPRKVKLIYEGLGVDSIDSLEAAVRAGKLRDLPGMGEKSEENILKSLALFRRGQGRFHLSVGFVYADAIIEHLRSVKGVERLEPAGSLRRRSETIGDLDILAICDDPAPVMDAFTSWPDVDEIIARGDTKSSVRLANGLQIDLRVLPAAAFGAALHYFTGSKQHNIAIRDRAKARGLKVSEYGVFNAKTDERVGGGTEDDVFAAVGLPLIPPELREARGEIEAAEKGELPALIEPADIVGDLQMHSTASDGRHRIAELAERAREMGYKYIAITDHSKAVRVAGGLDEEQYLKHLDAIEKADARAKGIRILKGIEVDILKDGALDLGDNVLERCDVVLASVHSGFKMPGPEMTRRVVKALRNPWVNMLAHPTGRLLLEREPFEIDLQEVFKVAREEGVTPEINADPHRLDLRDADARMARDMGLKIAIDTDAHSTDGLDVMRYGVFTARRAWLSRTDVINTLPLKQLLKALNR